MGGLNLGGNHNQEGRKGSGVTGSILEEGETGTLRAGPAPLCETNQLFVEGQFY